jgi:phospholipase D1/2
MSLAGIVHRVVNDKGDSENENASPSSSQNARRLGAPLQTPKRRSSGFNSTPSSPAGRTGPPSFSFPISQSMTNDKGKGREEGGSSPPSRMNSQGDPVNPPENESDGEDTKLTDPYRNKFKRTRSGFRSAWEYDENDVTAGGRSRKQRDSWLDVDGWNPIKWLGLTEADEGAGQDGDGKEKKENDRDIEHDTPTAVDKPENEIQRTESPQNTPEEPESSKPDAQKSSRMPRSFSLPHMKTNPAWTRLKALLPQVTTAANDAPNSALYDSRKRDVDIIQELTYAGLAPLILRMWFERDERDERRVPILMHQLRIRVSDSIYPLSNSKAVFRIECEYANGAARWVIYRQLRDFRKLNRHYRVANFYTMKEVKLPDFPRGSISKIHFYRLKHEKGSAAARAEFAKMQREILETYLIGLIKAVVCF